MTSRRDRGTALCRKLVERIATFAPPGLGRWDEAWTIVAPASADYMAALAAWEHDGTDASEARLRTAYLALVAAWERAAAEYRELDREER